MTEQLEDGLEEPRIRDLGKGAYIDYFPTWMPNEDANTALQAFIDELDWSEVSIRAKEKIVVQPRLTAWAGALPYRYSGQTLPPRPVPNRLQSLLSAVIATTGVEYNHAVINYYRHGNDHMGMHADDEPQLGRNPNIAAISLGAVRTFVLRPKGRKRYWVRYRLAHGSLLVMRGTVQHRWYHGVPKATVASEQAKPVGPRINVTFRRLLGGPASV